MEINPYSCGLSKEENNQLIKKITLPTSVSENVAFTWRKRLVHRRLGVKEIRNGFLSLN